MVCVVVVSIVLRFWARAVIPGVHFRLDDWLALGAVPPILGVLAIGIHLCNHIIGQHIRDLSPEKITLALQLFWAASILFDICLTLVRLSALAFYVRIFGFRTNHSRAWKIAFGTVAFITLAWPLGGISTNIFQCTPVRKYWTPDIPGHCISKKANFLYTALINVVDDILILLLPLPMLWKLQMRNSKKALIIGTFVVGYSIPLMSIGRLMTLLFVGDSFQKDFTYAVVPVSFWFAAETGLSIFAISLPALSQFFKRWWQFGPRSLVSPQDFSQYDSGARLQRSNRCDLRGHGKFGPLGPDSDSSRQICDTHNDRASPSQTTSEQELYPMQNVASTATLEPIRMIGQC